MLSLLKKEIRLFFSSPLAYLILFVFFSANALVLFALPSAFNLFDSGYASLEPFFLWAPLVFLFLVPALCMRSFSEEKKSGTIEVLLTRPLSAFQVVSAKYLACLLLLVISLLPTFLYLYTVSSMASPAGNIDLAAFWGAFLGLLCIGAVYAAICICMSSLTENQVVAFILSVALCAVCYQGFELLGALPIEGNWALGLTRIGIRYHYLSLSRGVLDLRDMAYYLTLTAIFLMLTVWSVGRHRRLEAGKFLYAGAAVIILDLLLSLFPVRLDLTADKRYTLMPVTRQILLQNQDPVLVKVYLAGDLPAGFKRLEKSVRETLDEFRIYRKSIRYQFVDIYAIEDEDARRELMGTLAERGISPTQLEVKTKEGLTRRLIFPAAELRGAEKTVAVSLLRPQLGRGAEETLNQSIENIELQLINAIRALSEPVPASVAFLKGQGELSYRETLSLGNALSSFYRTRRVAIDGRAESLLRRDSTGKWCPEYKVLVVAHPTRPFSPRDKLVLDQYLMYGGRILWLLDAGDGSVDSLRGKDMYDAVPYRLEMEDAFFRYGFRLRNEMLLDRNAALSPVVTGYMGQQPIIDYIPNYYTPVVGMNVSGNVSESLSLLATGVGPIRLAVASGLDTIENDIEKTVLLQTSEYTHRVRLPHAMSADLMRRQIDLRRFDQGPQTVALLLEGRFRSAFPLVRPALDADPGLEYRNCSEPTAMIVVGDGDLARNEWSSDGQTPFPTGFDKYTGQEYGNAEFLLNGVHYLAGNPDWTSLKPRTVRMRLLDKAVLEKRRSRMMWLNVWLPLGLTAVSGVLFTTIRRRRYVKGC